LRLGSILESPKLKENNETPEFTIVSIALVGIKAPIWGRINNN